MKKTHRQRWLSLLLTLAMCLTLAPAAWAEESGDSSGGGTETFEIYSNRDDDFWEINSSDRFLVKEETPLPLGRRAIWTSDNPQVASINDDGYLTPHKAGTANISAYYMTTDGTRVDAKEPIKITVSGLIAEAIEVEENGAATLSVTALGNALQYAVNYSVSSGDYFISVSGDQVSGLHIGEGKVMAHAGSYNAEITVTVISDSTTTIELDTMKSGETLPFSDLASNFASQISGKVQYITGLYVSTSQGTLYYGYRSEAEPGAGVGQVETYYRSPGPGQRALSDITFVPKPGYLGGNVTITYNAVTGEGRTYSCKIIFALQGTSSDSDSQASGISLNTEYNTAVQFDSIEFGAVCRERLGTQLDYVIFSQPPERQGALYTNYSSADSYGSLVDVRKQYSRRELDDVWFVPAPGYGNGTVTVYYTGFGTNGRSYSGQVNIKVGEEDMVAIGGLSYSVSPGSAVRFDDDDFNDYCYELLNQEQTLSGIRFESLPSESDGVLYYDYQSAANTGSRAAAGTVYYYGTRTPRIDRLAFVPAEDFNGTLKLPFTGWSTDGTSFSGNVEVNVRGSVASGDIYYYCAPGRSVDFLSRDFTNLSRSLTGRTLDYIRFRGLPSEADGSVYYGSSRVSSTGTSYTSSNISRLSFRASNRFSGSVNIPFEGRSTGGVTFTGVIAIGASGAGSAGSGSTTSSSSALTAENVTARYSTRTAPVRFYAGDLARSGSSLSSVQFTSLPPSSAGYLYNQYASPTVHGQQASTGTTYQTSGSNLISNLTFVPRAGYSGTVTIPYTGTNSSGATFKGEVVITVAPSYSSSYFSDMAGYSDAQRAAVDFLYDHNITHGLSTGQYGPENTLRRGDFALMLYQAFGLSPASYSGTFADVPPSAYYATAVDALYARGVVSGVGNGRYSPDSTLTRQDAICMVQRAMQTVGWSAGDGYSGALAGYGDSGSVSGYAQGAMALAVQRGYLPTAGSWLNPQQPLTRVDMAEILHRVLTY